MAEFLSLAEDPTSTSLDDFPPSYSEATTSSSFRPSLPPSSHNHSSSFSNIPTTTSATTSASPLPPSLTSPLTSPISHHLQTLPSRLRSSQQALADTRALHDLSAITALTPHIESFLQDLGNSPTPPPKGIAELTLIPASAVPKGWALSGGLERRREGEVVRVGRVDILLPVERKGGDKKVGVERKGEKEMAGSSREEDEDDEGYTYTGSRSHGFDEWGRFRDEDDGEEEEAGKGTFFRDERQARRLAGYLQPGRLDGNLAMERRRVQQAVVDAKRESGGRLGIKWGRKKSEGSSSTSSGQASTGLGKGEQGAGQLVQGDDRVSMTVRSEEVTFRKENDFGVWESRSGYGIVATIRVRRS